MLAEWAFHDGRNPKIIAANNVSNTVLTLSLFKVTCRSHLNNANANTSYTAWRADIAVDSYYMLLGRAQISIGDGPMAFPKLPSVRLACLQLAHQIVTYA